MFVFSPDTISYHQTILNDIDVERGKQNLPAEREIKLLYRDGVMSLPEQSVSNVANIEQLMAPWQILPYIIPSNSSLQEYYIYYRGTGESHQEFEFLFDYCFRSQLVRPEAKITVRGPNLCDNAMANFDIAKKRYSRARFCDKVSNDRVDQFSLYHITAITKIFSSAVIGMERR